MLKIASWNVNSLRARIDHVMDFLETEDPDVLLLQETKCEDIQFPEETFAPLPYNIFKFGQKSYNGVAILSKLPADEIKTSFVGNPCSDQARFIEIACKTSIGYSRIISVYVPNGFEVGSDKFVTKLEFYDALTAYLLSIKRHDEHLIIGGDFNVAPFDIDVYSKEEMKDSLCFSALEKDKMRILLNQGFEDLYRLSHMNTVASVQEEDLKTNVEQQSIHEHVSSGNRTVFKDRILKSDECAEFSWWDYRAGGFEKNLGLRIDMILGTISAANMLTDCFIVKKYRGLDKPSDHAPVVSVFEWATECSQFHKS
jgi:exodeoxyribonuclease-3